MSLDRFRITTYTYLQKKNIIFIYLQVILGLVYILLSKHLLLTILHFLSLNVCYKLKIVQYTPDIIQNINEITKRINAWLCTKHSIASNKQLWLIIDNNTIITRHHSTHTHIISLYISIHTKSALYIDIHFIIHWDIYYNLTFHKTHEITHSLKYLHVHYTLAFS